MIGFWTSSQSANVISVGPAARAGVIGERTADPPIIETLKITVNSLDFIHLPLSS